MSKEKQYIQRENGELVPAQFPVIVSASRSTDIPGFYSDWFLHRLKMGYSAWTNPFDGKKYYVSYRDTRLIVFWSKNPAPLLKHLDWFDDQGYGYRAGAGIFYSLSKNVALRGVARYVKLDKIKDIDHMMEYSAGLRYTFN